MRNATRRVLGREGDSATDALTLLRNDHAEVKSLFKTVLEGAPPSAQRRTAIGKILDALDLHARMEETIFYPAVRSAGGTEERETVLLANEEHGVAKELMAKIRAISGRDETLKAKLTLLRELVEEHIREEESEMFDEARRVLGEDRLREIGSEMERFKAEGGAANGRRQRNGSTRKAASARKGTRGKSSARSKGSARKNSSRKTTRGKSR